MQPELHMLFARERLQDDHGRFEPETDGTATLEPESITIRPPGPGDASAVELLAELDDSRVPAGPLLLAEVEGTIEAALAIENSESIANPFAASAGIVSLLELRAEQLRAA